MKQKMMILVMLGVIIGLGLTGGQSAAAQSASGCAMPSFAAAQNFGVGNGPFSVTVGDFNADGNLDLATANYFSGDVGADPPINGNVSVLLSDGLGGSAAAQDFGVGAAPRFVTTADFNADGKLDLAVVNDFSDNVSILLGDGTGSFSTAVNYDAGSGTASVTISDFNEDGKLDLVTANALADNVSILLGDGLGGFSAAVNFGAGDFPHSVTTGDYNGDGQLDLATANSLADNVSILLGDGLGGFSAATNYDAGDLPFQLTTADFNADGKLDLVTVNGFSENVSVLLGDGTGGFSAAVNYAVGEYPTSVTTGDFNGDGKLDLAVANRNDNVSLLLGDGTGGFSPAANFGAGDRPIFVTTADFNADGKLDLAVANAISDNVSILLSTCTANTAPVAVADSYSTNENTTLNVAAPGVTGNDTDNENDALTATLLTNPGNAVSFVLNSDGSFSYTPTANFIGSDSFTYQVSDGAANSLTATVFITVNDSTPPVITPNVTGTLGTNGWYRSDIGVLWTVTDGGSPVSVQTGCDAQTVSTDTGGITFTCTATSAGGTSTNSVTVKRDATNPIITFVSRTPAANGAGWNNTNVTVNWSCGDATSGAVNPTVSQTLTAEGAALSSIGTCTDNAGNSASNTQSGIKIDKTAPTLAPTVSPNPVLLGGTATATSNASDALSGIASQSCAATDIASVGSKTAACTATDVAGNTANAVANYRVVYNFAGFFQPVDNLPVINAATAGSSIPVKFSLSGNQGLAIFAAGYPSSGVIPCAGGTTSTIEETVTAGASTLTYDATTGQYKYVWKTERAWRGTCRQLQVRFVDGNTYVANFSFR